jgi:hypothetical protein
MGHKDLCRLTQPCFSRCRRDCRLIALSSYCIRTRIRSYRLRRSTDRKKKKDWNKNLESL